MADTAIDRSLSSGTAAASLVIEQLTRRYGEHDAVSNVSWSAAPGEIVCLLGHSGCGKTTLLRLIAGIEAPSAGRVIIDGEDLSGSRFVPPEKRRIGLVFQDYALFPHLSVLDNVTFGLQQLPRAQREASAMVALERVRLASHARQYPHTLSGGEQQRVALARALAPQPRVLLMDEPFSNLDRRLRDRVREDTLAVLRESGTTAVIVTHDPEEALRMADRIVLMHAGRVEQQGTPQSLYWQPQTPFAARYFCDLNEIPAQCRQGQVDTALGRFQAAHVVDGAALVCLRPQDLALADRADTDTVAATLRERVFLGDSEQLQVSVAGLEQPLTLRRHEPSALAAGQTVQLRIHRDRALVFPA